MSGDELPVLLTVEEAGALLRIGRTKAYAMAREWRETDGRSGLPIVDLGHVLRVPRRALEELIGAELTHAGVALHVVPATGDAPAATALTEGRSSDSHRDTPTQRPPTTGRTRRNRKRVQSQLDLFDSESRSS